MWRAPRATIRRRHFALTPPPICRRTSFGGPVSSALSRPTSSQRRSPSAAMVPSMASSLSVRVPEGTMLLLAVPSTSMTRVTRSTESVTWSTSTRSPNSASHFGSAAASRRAKTCALGASGVQVGTLFAYCDESGMDRDVRRQVLCEVKSGTVKVKTSLRASSTGYPFKVASVSDTISESDVYAQRERRCDLGYLREAYLTPNGSTGYRCAAEPVDAFIRKGGAIEATDGSTCLCNGLMATCGLGQYRSDGRREPPIVTSGDYLNDIRQLLVGREHYSAGDVIDHLSIGVDVTATGDDSFIR